MTVDNVIPENGHPKQKSIRGEVMVRDRLGKQLTLSEVMGSGFVLPKQTKKPYTSFPLLISIMWW